MIETISGKIKKMCYTFKQPQIDLFRLRCCMLCFTYFMCNSQFSKNTSAYYFLAHAQWSPNFVRPFTKIPL